jgi:hypothetical protein
MKLPKNVDFVISSPNMALKTGSEPFLENYLRSSYVEPKYLKFPPVNTAKGFTKTSLFKRVKINADSMFKDALAPQRNVASYMFPCSLTQSDKMSISKYGHHKKVINPMELANRSCYHCLKEVALGEGVAGDEFPPNIAPPIYDWHQ